MSKRIAIVDADLWAFKVSAAAEIRSIRVTHTPTGIQKSFKHRTEFKKSMEEKGKEITSDFVIEDVQDAEPLEFCLSTIKHKIKNIKRDLEVDEVRLFCGDQNNFRLDLPLPTKYKSTRANLMRPIHLTDTKQYLQKVQNATEAYGYECDDLLCITAYKELERGNIPIISSIDKDCMSHDGIWIHNPDKDELVLIPELGDLYLDKNGKVKGKGLKFLCHQWMFGDPVDVYCGYELSTARFGEKSSYALLNPLTSVKECLETVINQYKIFYPEKFEYTAWNGNKIEADWKYMLELYFMCAWMKRSYTDDSKPHRLFEKYGVAYD